MKAEGITLTQIFGAVGQVLESNRQAFNLADRSNGNHGDHMVRIFQLASQAADEKRNMPPAETMEYAARLLQEEKQNGSAQVYARGLSSMAEQFRKYEITLDDLVSYIQGVLVENRSNKEIISQKSGKVLKALVTGLAAWGQDSDGQTRTGDSLDMGALFEFGMIYLQARQRGGSRIEILADAAASACPLSKVLHRYLSGKVAIHALLQSVQIG